MRKIAKSKQMKFLDAFSALASSLGGDESSVEPSHECGNNFFFKTKGGVLTAHANCGIDYTIFCRFNNGEEAAIALGYKQTGEFVHPSFGRLLRRFDSSGKRLSPHSGKWNFHGDDADAILNAFRDELGAILSKEVAS